MKKLICVEDVNAAHENNQSLVVDCNTIVTPAAKDLIEILGVSVHEQHENEICGLPDELDKNTLLKLLKMILGEENTPFQAQQHPNGLKVIDGNSIKMDVFDTGNPDATVYYQELVSKKESKISAGLLEIHHSQFDWELTYEEIDYVISGNLEITIDGKKYCDKAGDIVFVPKNSKVTWGSPDKAKLFYATYPANWADLI